MPRLTNIGPPGSAKALISRTFTVSNVYWNSGCWSSAGMTATRRCPRRSTYDDTASSRMIGSCLRASAAACRPSSTSCDSLYLFGGGVIRVCAETSDPASASATVVAQNWLFIFLTLCKNDTDDCQQLSTSPCPDANCQLAASFVARKRSHFQYLATNPCSARPLQWGHAEQ